MPKKKTEKPQRVMTKRQLSRWQQQRRRQRIILGLGILIIATVLVIIGVGWYLGQYQPWQQTAIRVNETEFSMGYYVEMLKLQASNQSPQATPYLANQVVELIAQNELIRQAAAKLGFSVSKDDITAELKSAQLRDSPAQRDLIRINRLIRKLLDEYFEKQIPVSAAQVHLQAMLLESEPQAKEVSARLENSENFTPLAGELSLNFFSKTKQGDYGWHPQVILKALLPANVVEYAFSSEAGKLSPPLYDKDAQKTVGYWLVRVLDRDEEEEEAHIQIMLLGSEKEAREVRERLEAKEEFATLAKEFSQLEGVAENKGEYLVGPGMMSPAVDKFAFDLEIDTRTLSEPIRDETVTTKGGYWLVKVIEKDNDRPIAAEDRAFLKTDAFNEWASALRNDPKNLVEYSSLDDAKMEWALKQAAKG